MRSTLRLATIAMVLTALACDRAADGATDAGATDAPDAKLHLAPGEMCSTAESPPLALDAVTTLGFAPREVLSWLTAQHDSGLTWASGGQGCSVAPQGTTGVHILVTPSTASVTMGSMREGQGDSVRCRPVMTVPCQLSIWTDDGGIHEDRQTFVAAPSADDVRFWLKLPAWGGQDGAGSLAMTCGANPAWASEMTSIKLTGTLTPHASAGSATFYGTYTLSSGGYVSFMVPVASWGLTPGDAGVD